MEARCPPSDVDELARGDETTPAAPRLEPVAKGKREKAERRRRQLERKREHQRKVEELQQQLARRSEPFRSDGGKPLNPVRPDDVFHIPSRKGGPGKSSAGG